LQLTTGTSLPSGASGMTETKDSTVLAFLL